LPENIDEIKIQFRGAQGNYAAVGIADMKGMLEVDDLDSDESPIFRGNGLNVDYRGLVRID
jgi:hypothetical protein